MADEELKEAENIEIDNEKHIVAFLDILGFKSHIKNYLNPNKDEDREILNKIKFAFEEALNSKYAPILEYAGLNLHYKQFSDCTCLSIPDFRSNPEVEAIIHCNFIFLLREFYFSMLKFDVYIRGGLSVGFHYEDDNMIFSEGLIKAYELESKSVYPRIILDDELIRRFKWFWANHKDTISLFGVDKLLISDWDGSVFINPFNLSQALENMVLAGHTKKPSVYDESKDLKTNLVEIDYKAQMRVLKNLENKIEELRSDQIDDNILMKYIWLKELVKWNMDPESAKIKFEYLLK
jgi:hypothetical protein